jgi:hypothetical protein
MTSPRKPITALTPILGRWRTTGTVHDADGTITATAEGTDTYELLPGGKWIAHDVDVVISGERTLVHEIIGGTDGEHGWLMHAYGDDDRPETMRLTQESADLLLLRGDGIRSWFTVRTAEGSMTSRWERHDGRDWNLWMDMRFAPMD